VPTRSAFRVFGIGQCSLDHLVQVEAYPPSDSKCEVQDLVVQGGGPVATAMVALSRWGVACTFAGVIGDDEAGREIRISLERESVDLGGLVERPGSRSQTALVVAERRGGARTVLWRRATGPPLLPAEIDLDRLRRVEILHTDGLLIEAALHAAREARRAGVRVVVDAGTLREGMLDLARASDAFIASETFARALVGSSDAEAACAELAALGPGLVGVTLGDRGYVAREARRVWRGRAHAVQAVDTTGCGDVFHAGVTYGLLRGWAAERILDFAAWAAARVATRLGGRTGIPACEAYPGPSGVNPERSP
jgi:ribokinase